MITAKRGSGDSFAPPITDALISTVPVALARARNELDAHSGLIPCTLSAVYRAGIETGQLVQVHDQMQGAAWQGTIGSVEIRADGIKLTVTMGIERESDSAN